MQAREYKFRFRCNRTHTYLDPSTVVIRNGACFGIAQDGKIHAIPSNVSIEQFIRVEDKNDVEIYENDILHWTSGREDIDEFARVKWDERKLMFVARTKNNTLTFGDNYYGSFEVVGNIHTHASLIL